MIKQTKQKFIIIPGLMFMILLCGSFSAAAPASSQQTFTLVIREGMPAVYVGMPAFIPQDDSPEAAEAAKLLREVVKADLKYSRIYNPLPEDYYRWIDPLDPEQIKFRQWDSISARLLVVGQVAKKGDNILFEGRVFDVKAERFLRGKSYQAPRSLWRRAAHEFSNMFMEMVGEPKIFTTKVAFISNRKGNDELYIMDYDGHNQIRLTFNQNVDYMPAWSHDGRKIAYTSYRGEQSILYLLDIFEFKQEKIFDRGTNFAPNFSPDGKWLAFVSTQDQSNSDIYLHDLGQGGNGGGRLRRLTRNPAADTGPSWSPTGREIAFTSDRGGTPQIYIMDAEGGNVRRISFGGTYHDGAAWSPAGDRIAYVARVAAVFDIYVLNLNTNEIIKLTEGYAWNEMPTWSPDGRHLIFSSTTTGKPQLYTIDYDGLNKRRLTSQGENKLPNWSRSEVK